jgi:type I restriction enzyme S subunit
MTLRALGETAKFINGAAFSPTDWEANGLPIIRIQNLTGTGEKFNFTNRQVKLELVVEPGDLLVSWSATLDVYRWPGPRGVLNQHIFKVLPHTGIDPDYLFFALKTALAELSSKTHGSTMKHVVRGDFESTRVPVPPLPEQRRIVDLLSRAEGIVRLRREAEKKAAELIPALFIDMFGDPTTNPKAWRLTNVGNILQMPIRNGISPSKLGRVAGRVLTLSAITRRRFNPLAVKDAFFTARLSAGDEVNRDDFLVCRGNGNPDLVGRGCFPTTDMPGVAFPDTAIAVRLSPEAIEKPYFAALWETGFIRKQIRSVAKTTNGTYKINQPALAAITLPVPPRVIQRAFAEKYAEIHSIQSQQSAATAKAQAAFDALLARCFSPDSVNAAGGVA